MLFPNRGVGARRLAKLKTTIPFSVNYKVV
nr:MAG TPA: hypothetical protein [Caudoviricetes sp.]